MGLLDRWDARNQETLEFHKETAPPIEEDNSGRVMVLTWLGVGIGGFLLVVVLRAAGLSKNHADVARIVVLGVLTVVSFAIVIRQARRRRRKWQADRAAAESP